MTNLVNGQMTHSRWQVAAEMSDLGVWDYALDKTHPYVSDAWFALRGLAPQSDTAALRAQPHWIDHVHADDRTEAAKALEAFHSGAQHTLHIEYRERHAEGHYIWIMARGKIVEWHTDGTPVRFVGTDTDTTATKALETENQELQGNLMRYGVALTSARVGFWDTSLVNKDCFRSPGWKTMRGYAADSDYGTDFDAWRADVHVHDTEQISLQSYRLATSHNDDIVSAQYRQRRKDGTWMSILSRGSVVARDASGIALRAVGVDTDITDVKAKEAILRRLSKTLELAVSASQMGVWESFAETGDAIWDERTRDIFGNHPSSGAVSPEEFKSFVHPEDLPIVERDCAIPASRGEDFNTSFRIVHPEKGVRHVNIQAMFHPTHELGPRHVGIVFDITESVEREAALNRSNTLLADVLQQMEQGIAMFHGPDLHTSKVVLSNEKFFEMLEIERPENGQDLSFESYRAHIAPHVEWPQNGFASLNESIAAAAEGTGLNTLMRLHSGRVISITGVGHGNDYRIVTFTDMTELFKSESRRAELADSVRHLEKLQALGKLTGGVAHDFNNLLAVITGNAELLRDEPEGEADCLNAILVAARRGADLTQRLLAFSRKQPLQPTSIVTEQLLNNLDGLLRRTLGETIEIETQLDRETWNVHADLGQLENALINLAVNARDAMPEGGRLAISASNITLDKHAARKFDQLDPGEYVKFTVMDQGVGMDAPVLEKAFDPFFTTKDVGQGSGLGLSMVYGFIKQSNGDIKIQSRLRQWTNVLFLLPRSTCTVPATPKPSPSPAHTGARQTIALVEDDPSVRRMVEITLERLNYAVVPFPDAVEALAALEDPDFNPDLLISDVSLPGGMSGFDLGEKCAVLKPSTRVLYMSGYPDDLLPSHGIDLDTSVFIKKPFTIHDLGQRIDALLNA